MSWGRASFRTLPSLPSIAPSSSSVSFFLYVKRLEHPRCWTVSNRFVCEGEASHSEYHNAILSLLVTPLPYPWTPKGAWVTLRDSSAGIKNGKTLQSTNNNNNVALLLILYCYKYYRQCCFHRFYYYHYYYNIYHCCTTTTTTIPQKWNLWRTTCIFSSRDQFAPIYTTLTTLVRSGGSGSYKY